MCHIRSSLYSDLQLLIGRSLLTTSSGLYSLFRINATNRIIKQESRAVARIPRDVAAVLFGLKFHDNIHYKFKNSRASKAVLQSSKHTGVKQNLTQIAVQG